MKRFLMLAVATAVLGSVGCSSMQSSMWPFSDSPAAADAAIPPADGVVQTEYRAAGTANAVNPPSVLPQGQ